MKNPIRRVKRWMHEQNLRAMRSVPAETDADKQALMNLEISYVREYGEFFG